MLNPEYLRIAPACKPKPWNHLDCGWVSPLSRILLKRTKLPESHTTKFAACWRHLTRITIFKYLDVCWSAAQCVIVWSLWMVAWFLGRGKAQQQHFESGFAFFSVFAGICRRHLNSMESKASSRIACIWSQAVGVHRFALFSLPRYIFRAVKSHGTER